MSSPRPFVTVVIPCHNHAQWIHGAIESIGNQDYPHDRMQIVMVDDGSTDGSVEAVTGHSSSVEFKLVRNERAHGPSYARNRGVEAGWDKSDLFAFLDSDDLYEPTKISKSVTFFEEQPDMVGAIYSDFDTLNPSGLRLRQWKEPFSRERLTRECIINCDSLVSKLALGTCGGFDEEMRTCEDYDLWMRISEAFTIVHIAESLVTVRVGPHSSTANVPSETWNKNWQRVMDKTRTRANKTNV